MDINFYLKLDGEVFKPGVVELVILDKDNNFYVANIVNKKDTDGLNSVYDFFKLLRAKIDEMETLATKHIRKCSD